MVSGRRSGSREGECQHGSLRRKVQREGIEAFHSPRVARGVSGVHPACADTYLKSGNDTCTREWKKVHGGRQHAVDGREGRESRATAEGWGRAESRANMRMRYNLRPNEYGQGFRRALVLNRARCGSIQTAGSPSRSTKRSFTQLFLWQRRATPSVTYNHHLLANPPSRLRPPARYESTCRIR
jgi:hypothetical protein